MNKIHTIGADTPEAGKWKMLLADVRKQLADVTGQLQSIPIDIFRQELSEKSAASQGTLARLGVRGQLLQMSGVSVDDSRTQGVYSSEKRAMQAEANRLTALALDRTNSLSPEEREATRTQAAQLRFQANKALPNEIFNRQQSEQAADQGYRGAQVGLGLAQAQAHGSAQDVVEAQRGQLAETIRKEKEAQDDILTMVQQGIGTEQQRKAIQTQLLTLQAQEVQIRQQINQAAYDTLTSEASAGAGAGAALSRRLSFGKGTTTASLDATASSLDMDRQNVALLYKQAHDPTLDPKKRMEYERAYEEAQDKANQDSLGLGTFQESADTRLSRQGMEGRLRRAALSPFGRENTLPLVQNLLKLNDQEETGIKGQIKYIGQQRDSGKLTEDQYKENLLHLQGQLEDVKTDSATKSASVAQQMFNDEINLSSGTTSFASRLLPSPMDAARSAQRMGLGPIAARAFGFYGRKTYDDAMKWGLEPISGLNPNVWGANPGAGEDDGKVTFGGPGLVPAGGGGKMSDSGAAGDLAHFQSLIKEFATTTQTLVQGLQTGSHVVVTINDASGKALTSTVVNVGKNQNSTAIQKGGASAPPGHKPFGW